MNKTGGHSSVGISPVTYLLSRLEITLRIHLHPDREEYIINETGLMDVLF